MKGQALLIVAVMSGLIMSGCVESEAGPAARPTGAGGAPVPEAVGPATFDETTGAIEGLLTDDEIQPIPGAQIGIIQLGLATVTDIAGRFVFSNLVPGTYTVTAAALGFHAGSRGVTVVAGEATEVNLVIAAIPVVEPYYETFPFTGFISCGAAVIRTTLPANCNTVTGTGNTDNWHELYGSCSDTTDGDCEEGEPSWPITWNATLVEAEWDSNANPDWLAFDYNDRVIGYYGVYFRYRGLNPVKFLVERCASYMDTDFGRAPTPCTDEEVAKSGMHIETFYVGKFQEETHTFDSVCNQNQTIPAYGTLPGYQAGCYGVGPALNLKWDNWVTVFHMELPADIASFSARPDA